MIGLGFLVMLSQGFVVFWVVEQKQTTKTCTLQINVLYKLRQQSKKAMVKSQNFWMRAFNRVIFGFVQHARFDRL